MHVAFLRAFVSHILQHKTEVNVNLLINMGNVGAQCFEQLRTPCYASIYAIYAICSRPRSTFWKAQETASILRDHSRNYWETTKRPPRHQESTRRDHEAAVQEIGGVDEHAHGETYHSPIKRYSAGGRMTKSSESESYAVC